jgi:hypothetical protein
MLLQMVPFGYHFLPQIGVIRILTGQLFGVGLVGYLTLVPMSYVLPAQLDERRRSWTHAVGGLASLILLQVVVRSQSRLTAEALAWLGLLGLLLLAVLVVVNLILLPVEIGRLVRRRRTSKSP